MKLFEPHGKITFLDYMFHWSGPKKGQPRGYCFLEYEKKQVGTANSKNITVVLFISNTKRKMVRIPIIFITRMPLML